MYCWRYWQDTIHYACALPKGGTSRGPLILSYSLSCLAASLSCLTASLSRLTVACVVSSRCPVCCLFLLSFLVVFLAVFLVAFLVVFYGVWIWLGLTTHNVSRYRGRERSFALVCGCCVRLFFILRLSRQFCLGTCPQLYNILYVMLGYAAKAVFMSQAYSLLSGRLVTLTATHSISEQAFTSVNQFSHIWELSSHSNY